MRYLGRFLDVVEFTTFDRLPIAVGCRTPPVNLVGTGFAEDLHSCRPIGQVATRFLVDVEIPGRIGIEAGEDCFLVPTRLSRLLKLDLRITVSAGHSFEGDVTEHLVPTDWTPEELEHRRTIPLDRFETRR